MTPDQRFLATGIYLSSSLYLAGCFLVGILQQHSAWRPALVAMGLNYVVYFAQLISLWRWFCLTLVAASILFGVLAGVEALWEI